MIERQKLGPGLAKMIVQDVVKNSTQPGETLDPEVGMMERYGVSRGTLREALRILEVLGFVRMKPGPKGGPVLLEPGVRHFSDIATLYYQRINATYRELLEVRLTLEPPTAAMAARRRTEANARKLQERLELIGAIDIADDLQFRRVGQDFHEDISRMSGNRIADLMIQSCFDLFAMRAGPYVYSVEDRAEVTKIHEGIAGAIIRGDADAAESLMREHMKDLFREAMKNYSNVMDEVVQW